MDRSCFSKIREPANASDNVALKLIERRSRNTAFLGWMLVATATAIAQQPPVPKSGATPDTIPQGPLGDSIRLGKLIFTQTPTYARKYVGNQLSCSNCHLAAGAAPFAAPLVGSPGLFPMFDRRANRVITFAERIQECFVRSENGHPLPYDGPEMTALIAYAQWLSQGQPAGREFPGRGLVHLPELTPDVEYGEQIYLQQCSGCHGKGGAGMPPAAPPVWGPGAYNNGAGMNVIANMAAFVQHNMPPNKPGSLSAQESYNVAAFIHSKPHPVLNKAYASY
jgi:thiosulfate dehydrogenase